MKSSRKRFNNNDGGNKRKSRKLKPKSNEAELVNEEEIVHEEDMETQNASALVQTTDISVIQTCSQPYSEEDDKKIIKYFKGNMNWLSMRDDLSVYHVLKAKYAFQKSVKSLQSRFINVILPNLFKYNVMNHSDLIDFYDAARLELPDEFMKILIEQEALNEKSTSTSAQVENIAVPGTSRDTSIRTNVADAPSGTLRKKFNDRMNKCTENISVEKESIALPDTSKQSDSRTEVACAQSSTPKKMCLKYILGFIQFNNSEDSCVFIPDTEPNIASIENRLLDEFGIQQDSIKIIPKRRFDKMKLYKDKLDMYNKLMTGVFINRRYVYSIIRILPDFSNFFELTKRVSNSITSSEENNLPANEVLVENQLFPVNNETPPTENRINDTTTIPSLSCTEIEIENLGQIITSLSDSLDDVTISSNKECGSPNKSLGGIKAEPVDQDDVETIICSPYFVDQDHTYSANNSPNKSVINTEVTSPSNNLTTIQCVKDLLENKAMDMEANSPDSDSPNKCLCEIQTKPVDQDNVETVVRSPYFADHICSNNNTPNKNVTNTEVTSPSNNLTTTECTKDVLENNSKDMESNSPDPDSYLIDNACIPQIVFSKRCKDKIAKEKINVDHLILNVNSIYDETPDIDNFDKNKSDCGDNKSNCDESKSNCGENKSS